MLDPATGQEKEVLSRRTRMRFPEPFPERRSDRLHAAERRGRAPLCGVRLTGGDIRQVTQGKGENNVIAHWSGDGTSLYFYQLHPTKSFRRISVEGGTSAEVAALRLLQ